MFELLAHMLTYDIWKAIQKGREKFKKQKNFENKEQKNWKERLRLWNFKKQKENN